jgi:hypothetical protein
MERMAMARLKWRCPFVSVDGGAPPLEFPASSPAALGGELHDQADAEWMLIRGP